MHLKDDDEALLKFLWNNGFSGSEIAGCISPFLTPSAVLGRVHRMQLPGRQVDVRALVKRSVPPKKSAA